MTGRTPRIRSLLAAALLLFANARGLLGHLHCPKHDGAVGAAVARHGASATAAPTHGSHAGHHPAAAPVADQNAPGQDESPNSGPCACLDHCAACQTVAMPTLAASTFLSPPLADARRPSTSAASALPARAAHQLPFATTPPAIA